MRLVGVALGCWLAGYVVVKGTATVGLVLITIAGALAVLLVLVIERGGGMLKPESARVAGWAVASVLLGIAIGAVSASARVIQRDGELLSALASGHKLVRVGLVVSDDPRRMRNAQNSDSWIVSARIVWIEAEYAAVSGALPQGTGVRSGRLGRSRFDLSARIVVFASGERWHRLLPGQRIVTAGTMSPAKGRDLTAVVLSARQGSLAARRAPWTQRAAGGLRAGLRSACRKLPAETRGLLPGLVVGDTENLDPALADDFQATGMTHLYAVSGANCAIVVGAVLAFCRYCRAGPRLSAGISVLALLGFVILARPSPSVLRAAVMTGLTLVALAVGRQPAAVPALATAVCGLVVVDPGLAVDAGFALSVAATAGLLLLAPCLARLLQRHRVPGWAAQALAVCVAAQVACAPIIAALNGSISMIAVPVNLLAGPAVAPATVLGVVAVLLGQVWPTGAECVAWLASWPARWLVWLAKGGAAIPDGVVPWPGGFVGGLLLAAGLVIVLLAAMARRGRRLVVAVTIAAVVGTLPIRFGLQNWPPTGWFVVACDVGQGDAIVMRAAPRQAVVVDTGPEPGLIHSCLRSLRVETVPLLLISHCHADHVGGIAGVARGRTIGTIVVPEVIGESDDNCLDRLPAPGARQIRQATLGDQYNAGAVRLSVLGPAGLFRGTRSDANNNSLLTRADVDGHSVLLAGDAEIEAQSALLHSGPASRLSAEVLKVAHHGSAYQDERFLAEASPRIALVSVGRGNRLGHPAPSVLAKLAGRDIAVARTDLDGSIAVTSHRAGLAIVTHRTRRIGRSS